MFKIEIGQRHLILFTDAVEAVKEASRRTSRNGYIPLNVSKRVNGTWEHYCCFFDGRRVQG